jgi:hypothetical protein
MSEDERLESGISRRTALKRIGAAGAIAWATPVISSLSTPAFAGTITDRSCDVPGTCGNYVQCGTGESPCYCFMDVTGAGVCLEDAVCADVQTCATGGCPSGFVCAVQTCCGTSVCLRPCPDPNERRVASVATGSGPTASGH